MVAIFNPSTGITSFDAPDTNLPEKKQIEEYKQRSYERGKQQRILIQTKQRMQKIDQIKYNSSGPRVLNKTIFARTLRIGQPRKALTSKDHLKILRFKNKLEKEKLKNALERYKIAHQIDLARKRGILQPAQQVMSQPIQRLNYPAYSTPMEQSDIDSAFNADIGNGETSLFGNEQYHGENYFDNNDFFLENEFNQDPLLQLAIKARAGISPLWW